MLIFIIFLLSYCRAVEIDIYTIPEIPAGKESTVQTFEEGKMNAQIRCSVFVGGQRRQTLWYIKRETMEETLQLVEINQGVVVNPADMGNKTVITGEPIINLITFYSNFSIVNFTDEFNRTVLQCGTYGVRKTFLLGFPG